MDQGARKEEAAGLIRGLFDFSFQTSITTKVVRFLYILYVVGIAFAFLGGMFAGLASLATSAAPASMGGFGASGLGGGMGAVGAFLGILQICVTPVACAMALIYGRVMFECIIVFFRVAEHIGEIDRKTRG
jgi:hypothetical protein